jgi:Ribosomal protein L5
MARLQQQYRDMVAPAMMAKFGYTSAMQVPRLTKITLNMGVSEAVSDKKVMDNAVADLTKIAGQKPVVTVAKKPIAGFKIREGQAIGCMVTLRGVQMWEFLDRLAYVTSVVSLVAHLMVVVTTTSALKSRSFSLKLSMTKLMLCVVSISASPQRLKLMKSAKHCSQLSVSRSKTEVTRG